MWLKKYRQPRRLPRTMKYLVHLFSRRLPQQATSSARSREKDESLLYELFLSTFPLQIKRHELSQIRDIILLHERKTTTLPRLIARLEVDRVDLEADVLVLDVRVHVGALLRPVTAVRTLEPGAFAAFVLVMSPESVPLLVDLAAVLADVTLRGLLLLLAQVERLLEGQSLLEHRISVPVCCKQARKERKL